MKNIKIFIIFCFDLIDKYFHQKKILFYLKLAKIKISTFIDVGAHKGAYTDLVIKNFNIKKVLMFEPQKQIFKIIKEKYKKKRIVKVYNLAASNENKYQNFYINRHDLTSSLNKLDLDNSYLKKKSKLFVKNKFENLIKEICVVKTIKLRDMIKKCSLKKIDLIKIDTEGHELEVLLGLEKYIKKINVILIEFHRDKIFLNYNSRKIHKYLQKNNFVLKKIFRFPFTYWEDRIYLNKKFLKN